ncbi:MAG: hypothetical protein WC091_10280 [Sulfuricellaceae bacterium]
MIWIARFSGRMAALQLQEKAMERTIARRCALPCTRKTAHSNPFN